MVLFIIADATRKVLCGCSWGVRVGLPALISAASDWRRVSCRIVDQLKELLRAVLAFAGVSVLFFIF